MRRLQGGTRSSFEEKNCGLKPFCRLPTRFLSLAADLAALPHHVAGCKRPSGDLRTPTVVNVVSLLTTADFAAPETSECFRAPSPSLRCIWPARNKMLTNPALRLIPPSLTLPSGVRQLLLLQPQLPLLLIHSLLLLLLLYYRTTTTTTTSTTTTTTTTNNTAAAAATASATATSTATTTTTTTTPATYYFSCFCYCSNSYCYCGCHFHCYCYC